MDDAVTTLMVVLLPFLVTKREKSQAVHEDLSSAVLLAVAAARLGNAWTRNMI